MYFILPKYKFVSFFYVCSFKQGTRHYIYTIVNIIEELKWKYNYEKS